jgi:hypothetical protein
MVLVENEVYVVFEIMQFGNNMKCIYDKELRIILKDYHIHFSGNGEHMKVAACDTNTPPRKYTQG